jgi:hypothetical protein
MSVSSQGNYEGLSVTSGWVEEGVVGGPGSSPGTLEKVSSHLGLEVGILRFARFFTVRSTRARRYLKM